MKYAVLLRPTDNIRYYENIKKLSLSEIRIAAKTLEGDCSDFKIESLSGLNMITFDGSITDNDIKALQNLSACMAVCRVEDGLQVYDSLPYRYMPDSLPGILKYKGKTNPIFTAMMINIAAASTGIGMGDKMSVFDPMCGRGTTLFIAATRGYDCFGVEKDKKAIDELDKYYQRFLKQERYKHQKGRVAITIAGQAKGQRHTLTSANNKADFKAGNVHKMVFANGDTKHADILLKGEKADIMVVDLPYGIQHSGHGEKLSGVIAAGAKSWKKVLKKGGCGVIAYNSNSISREKLMECFEGYDVFDDELYVDAFSHYVEQGILRDILVVKNK